MLVARVFEIVAVSHLRCKHLYHVNFAWYRIKLNRLIMPLISVVCWGLGKSLERITLSRAKGETGRVSWALLSKMVSDGAEENGDEVPVSSCLSVKANTRRPSLVPRRSILLRCPRKVRGGAPVGDVAAHSRIQV